MKCDQNIGGRITNHRWHAREKSMIYRRFSVYFKVLRKLEVFSTNLWLNLCSEFIDERLALFFSGLGIVELIRQTFMQHLCELRGASEMLCQFRRSIINHFDDRIKLEVRDRRPNSGITVMIILTAGRKGDLTRGQLPSFGFTFSGSRHGIFDRRVCYPDE
jgi:hypothetical protein